MARPGKNTDREFADRLRQAIEHTGMKQNEFANSIGVSDVNISRYVTAVQAPDAPAMMKLAKGLPGQFEWVLTGVRPTDLEQRTVGSLPPPLRKMVADALRVSPDLQHALEVCAHLFANGVRDQSVAALKTNIIEWDHLLQQGTEVPRNAPIDLNEGASD